MSKKNLSELEAQLARMKAREAELKEQLIAERKAADARAQKELWRKKVAIADVVIEYLGEDILERTESLSSVLSRYGSSLRATLYRTEGENENEER